MDLPLVLSVLTGVAFLPSVYFAFVRDFWPMVYFATLMYVFKLWFVDRVGVQYGSEVN